VPHTSPVGIELASFVGDQGVELRPVRVRGEDHAVSVVVEGVEQERDPIISGELDTAPEVATHQAIPLEDARDHAVGLPVLGTDPHVEAVVVEQDTNLGDFRRGCAHLRLALPKAPGDRSETPGGLGQGPIQLDPVCRRIFEP
jgi:hypothetical protein